MTEETSRHVAPDRRRKGADEQHADGGNPLDKRDEILSVVSHDLRNPIGAVITGVRFLLDEPEILEDPEAVREQLYLVLRSAESADRLLRDLLDLTSTGGEQLAIEPAEVRVPALVDEVLAIVGPRADEADVELEVDLDEALPVLRADRERLNQVLLNLLDNAIKFTPPGGQVELGAHEEGPDAVRLRVSDTGPGIPRNEQDRIFERYWHSGGNGTPGTGLGLAIVKEIVGRHGGRIELESRPGEGTTFVIILPLDSGSEEETEARDPAA